MWLFTQPAWKRISASKQSRREEAITTCLASLSAESAESGDERYTNATASQIVENIANGKWLAVDVAVAYIRRAAYVQGLYNPITEVLFTDAIQQAKELDEEFKRTGQIRGPLHGVPISVKDQFSITGYDSTVGISGWCDSPFTSDAAVVRAVRKAGAVIICKTNIPQTMLNFESVNPVWGRTLNPWVTDYTCGGSSGGEGVMLATDASAIGIGSDVGGSLRIPALYCGIYSLKPTAGRISRKGARSCNPGFDEIKVTPGPMARSVEDVERLSRIFFSYDPANDYEGLAPVPYRDVELPKKLRIGYYFEDGFVRTSPANRRAVQETVTALEKAGHELVEFDLPFGPKSIQLFAGISSADGYRSLLSACGDDPIEKNLFLITLGPRLFRWVQVTAAWLIKKVMKDDIFANTFLKSKHSTLTEFWKNMAAKDLMNKEFYEQVWDKHGFDAIIAPGMVCPALPHGATMTLSPLANGTFYYNIVDSPVGVIPVTRVDPEKDQLSTEWTKLGEQLRKTGYEGSTIINGNVYGVNGVGGVYDPTKMKGLPVGVQVVGRKWEDEKVVAIMHVVDKALGPRGFGPGSWKGAS
ncbi:amidase signature enzyme [Serendipita vermifera]|nr:amidase signature enzyme [Serendipita vermifera]